MNLPRRRGRALRGKQVCGGVLNKYCKIKMKVVSILEPLTLHCKRTGKII
jgi:hypothetical protein